MEENSTRQSCVSSRSMRLSGSFKNRLKDTSARIRKLVKQIPCNNHFKCVKYRLPYTACVLESNYSRMLDVYNKENLQIQQILETEESESPL